VTALTLGFIPLTDCAPLLVASAKGFFAAEGLAVSLSREASWATVRDKVTFGALDGAHMLGPMALAASLGLGGGPAELVAPMALNRNGGGIVLSTRLMEQVAAYGSLKAALAARAEPATFAVVFPYSIHAYALREWLQGQGVVPDVDAHIVVTPPPRTAEELVAGRIDGFCAGGPWPMVATRAGAGRLLATTAGLYPGAPDKVLGLSPGFAERQPETLSALLRALVAAGRWADDTDNRAELIALLAEPGAVGAAAEAIAPAFDHQLRFQADGAGVLSPPDGRWILSQMQRWGQAPGDLDPARVDAVFRPDLLQQALRQPA
jgi:NitT/TauT family transport system ATP-binding protein/nitrate/nitrite transport system substrate-binding protein